ncbi:MAG: DUF1667 domain-containing protein [Bacillota bacterium]
METNKVITCISCPRGCRIEVRMIDGAPAEIKGYQCKRGLLYAEAEARNPVRILTTTVRVEGGERPVLPVRTKAPIPKESLRKAMLELKGVVVRPPVEIGATVYPNIAGTGVDVIATDRCR